MAGLTVNTGLQYFGDLIYRGVARDDLVLGLFTAPTTISASNVWADITQPSGAGYAEINLLTSNWVVNAFGTVTYPQQEFEATADWSPGLIYGYYIRTDGTIKLVHMELLDAPFEMTSGRKITIDLSVDTS